MKRFTLALGVFVSTLLALPTWAADYVIDTQGAHASINFQIPHLGFSILVGRFDEFAGGFSYDPNNLDATKVDVTVKTTSLNSNHGERDKHLRSADFLNTEKFPEARFVGTGFKSSDNGKTGTLSGDLTFHGVTKPIDIKVTKVGEGKDPWGGYRAGFQGTTTLVLKDWGITTNLGPASTAVDLTLNVEGVKQ